MRRAYGRLTEVLCSGGPWHGKLLKLRAETMIFTVGEFKGRYRLDGRWEHVL